MLDMFPGGHDHQATEGGTVLGMRRLQARLDQEVEMRKRSVLSIPSTGLLFVAHHDNMCWVGMDCGQLGEPCVLAGETDRPDR